MMLLILLELDKVKLKENKIRWNEIKFFICDSYSKAYSN